MAVRFTMTPQDRWSKRATRLRATSWRMSEPRAQTTAGVRSPRRRRHSRVGGRCLHLTAARSCAGSVTVFVRAKEELARLISLENGKVLSEARGEVQEVIDICGLAVGQSRQLFGREIASERRDHRLVEQWLPLGVVGIISAFNFPVAVPGWGWAIALVCGDTIVWKPSSLTPLISIAAQQIFHNVTAGTEAERVFSLIVGGGSSIGEALLADERVPLIQATGSCALGERVSVAVAKRSGRAILELGGNNAVIVMADADLKLALRAVVVGTVGTAGQR